MTAAFTWLDAHAGIYWWLALLPTAAGAAWIGLGWRASGAAPAWHRHAGWGGVLLFAVLLGWRWPALFEIKAATAGEARLIAGALTMAHDPLPFHAVDLAADGPLGALALLPTHGLGVPQDYFNARLVGLLFDWGALVAAFLLLREFFSGAAVALWLLLPLLWLATSSHPALAGYSSVHPAMFLGALGARWLWGGGALIRAKWLGAGVCLGLLPWVSPTAAAVAGLIWLGAAWPGGASWPQRRMALAGSGATALYLVALMLALLHGTGRLGDFWLGYVRENPAWGWTGDFWLGPAAVIAGRAILLIWVKDRPGTLPRSLPAPVAAALVTAAAVGLFFRVPQGVPGIFGHFAAYWMEPRSELGRRIHRLQQWDDTLAVWGERPQLNVETRLPQAVRASRVGRGRSDTPAAADAFAGRFLADLKRNKPVFFVDATGPGASGGTDRARFGFTAFPELYEYVRLNYQLNHDDGEAQLYLRSDRVAAIYRTRSGAVPLTLAGMRTGKALGGVAEIGQGRFGAHAPSSLVYSVPAGARALRGVFGFMDGAYADPNKGTDGARFIVEAVVRDGQRQRLLERQLSPASRVADRGPVEFAVNLPGAATAEVEFIIDPGPTTNFDWTYWGSLQFEDTPADAVPQPGPNGGF